MKVLLIEDEPHKNSDLMAAIGRVFGKKAEVTLCKAVKDGYMAAFEREFDVVILDMALPTFPEDGDAAGLAQASGGMEIVRLLAKRRVSSKVIIVTQYPEVIINNTIVKLSELSEYVSSRYGLPLSGCVLYSFDDAGWQVKLMGILEAAK